MISHLEGKIILKKEKFVVLDVNGVGYKVFLSGKTMSNLPEAGKIVRLFCFLNVRETALELYGFLTEKELEFFEILDSIRGVGPKAALEISSIGSFEEIKKRILEHDEKIFEGVPGIGRKKAAAIILELSGKIKNISKTFSSAEAPRDGDEAEEGLVSLGFSRRKIKEVLSKIPKDIKETEQRIKKALEILGKR